MGKPASSHCTIVLRDTIKEPFHVHLSWLAYDYWINDLSHYEVFRQDPGKTVFKKVGEIDRDILSYVDSFLCEGTYCYYVEAVNKNGEYRSRSNTICDKVWYVKPDGVSAIELVSVKNDKYNEIFWKPYYRRIRGSSWILERSALPSAGFAYAGEFAGLKGADMSADVHTNAWFYRVMFKDHCGNIGVPGAWSNSIFVHGVPGTTLLKIDWNDYQYWFSGVKEYHLQLKDNKGIFNTFKTYPAGTTEQDNVDLEKFAMDSVFIRVLAIKDSATFDTSVSNVAVFVPKSYLWVPTSFTPNNNGLNEEFKPVVGFVWGNTTDARRLYHFRILNRWGEVVFKTNDPTEGWNGQIHGNPAQSGVYIWDVRAVGFDGMTHTKKGTVNLLR
jgi:gliding motility-associated-like protein